MSEDFKSAWERANEIYEREKAEKAAEALNEPQNTEKFKQQLGKQPQLAPYVQESPTQKYERQMTTAISSVFQEAGISGAKVDYKNFGREKQELQIVLPDGTSKEFTFGGIIPKDMVLSEVKEFIDFTKAVTEIQQMALQVPGTKVRPQPNGSVDITLPKGDFKNVFWSPEDISISAANFILNQRA